MTSLSLLDVDYETERNDLLLCVKSLDNQYRKKRLACSRLLFFPFHNQLWKGKLIVERGGEKKLCCSILFQKFFSEKNFSEKKKPVVLWNKQS